MIPSTTARMIAANLRALSFMHPVCERNRAGKMKTASSRKPTNPDDAAI
jgi:hypothetical protein